MRVLVLSLLLLGGAAQAGPDSAEAREAYFEALGFGDGFSDEDMALAKALAEGDEMTGLAALLLMADELAAFQEDTSVDPATVRHTLERTDAVLLQHPTAVATLLEQEQRVAVLPPGTSPPRLKLQPPDPRVPTDTAPTLDLSRKPTRPGGVQALTVKDKTGLDLDTPPARTPGPALRPVTDPSQRLTRLLSLREKAYARLDTPAPALPAAVGVQLDAVALQARRPEGPITAVVPPAPRHSLPERHHTQVQVEATLKTPPTERTWGQWAYALIFGD